MFLPSLQQIRGLTGRVGYVVCSMLEFDSWVPIRYTLHPDFTAPVISNSLFILLTMPTLNDLAPELLNSICQEVDEWSCHQSKTGTQCLPFQLYTEERPLLPLKNLNLVCKTFHRAATRPLFQRVVVDFTAKDPERCALFLGFIISHAHIRSHIRSIVLPVRRYGWHANHAQLENALVSLLQALPRLQRITSVKRLPESVNSREC